MKDFAVLTSDMELVLDIVEALEASGHSVKLLDEAAEAMDLQPAPDALILDSAASSVDSRIPSWAAREHIPVVVIGPEAAESMARQMGAHFVERSVGSRTHHARGRFPTDPNPLWPLVLLDTVESAAMGAAPPLHRPSSAPWRPPSLPAVEDAGSVGPVLVIEDDDANCALIGRVLREVGFRVETAKDGFEALEQLGAAGELPCAIVLDLMMPRMNGWELQRALASDARFAHIPVVVASALAPAQELKGVVSAQLHKPFEASQLVRTVARAVGSPVD